MRCSPISVQSPDGVLTGIEDMAVMSGGALLLSAYSRKNPDDWPAGLFQVQPAPDRPTWTAEPLTGLEQGAFPHGFALNDVEDMVAVILRYREGKPKLGLYGLGDDRLAFRTWLADPESWTYQMGYPCNMNDVAFMDEGDIIVTNDRASCGGVSKWIETLTGKAAGQILKISQSGDVTQLKDGLYFPNGITTDAKGDIIIAQTRGRNLSRSNSPHKWKMPGAPDNLSYDGASNTVWAATIPSLPRYAAYQRGLLPSKSASMAVEISLESNAVKAYRTTDFEGATSVAVFPQFLILSGAFSDGLALCGRPDA